MSDLKTNQDGFIINEKYKPVVNPEEIQNHLIQLEPMTYRDALHLSWIEVNKSDLDEEIKRQVVAHLGRIFLRVEI